MQMPAGGAVHAATEQQQQPCEQLESVEEETIDEGSLLASMQRTEQQFAGQLHPPPPNPSAFSTPPRSAATATHSHGAYRGGFGGGAGPWPPWAIGMQMGAMPPPWEAFGMHHNGYFAPIQATPTPPPPQYGPHPPPIPPTPPGLPFIPPMGSAAPAAAPPGTTPPTSLTSGASQTSGASLPTTSATDPNAPPATAAPPREHSSTVKLTAIIRLSCKENELMFSRAIVQTSVEMAMAGFGCNVPSEKLREHIRIMKFKPAGPFELVISETIKETLTGAEEIEIVDPNDPEKAADFAIVWLDEKGNVVKARKPQQAARSAADAAAEIARKERTARLFIEEPSMIALKTPDEQSKATKAIEFHIEEVVKGAINARVNFWRQAGTVNEMTNTIVAWIEPEKPDALPLIPWSALKFIYLQGIDKPYVARLDRISLNKLPVSKFPRCCWRETCTRAKQPEGTCSLRANWSSAANREEAQQAKEAERKRKRDENEARHGATLKAAAVARKPCAQWLKGACQPLQRKCGKLHPPDEEAAKILCKSVTDPHFTCPLGERCIFSHAETA